MLVLAIIGLLATRCHGALRGDLEPLGGHKPPTVDTHELREVPQPREFYRKFVSPRIPVVFRGAALHSAATSRWDPTTLEKEYGDLVVKVEARVEQSNKVPVTEIGMGRSTLRHFASNYATKDIYVISQIPEPMERDVAIPPCLRCGNFARGIHEVHLFIVGPGGKTLLHRDPYSNIHCVFNGSKDWILIQDKYEEFLYQSASSVDEFGGYSNVDVDAVDLKKFPDIQKVNYSLVKMTGGDCLFVPGGEWPGCHRSFILNRPTGRQAGYWHQVRVNGDYNAAVSIWFSRDFKSFQQDWSNCLDDEYDFTPLSDVDVIWRFSGGNTSLSQGHADIHLLRSTLLSLSAEDNGLSLLDFCRGMIRRSKGMRCEDIVHEMKKVLQTDTDLLSESDVRMLTVQQLKMIMAIIIPLDEANTLDYEYSVLDGDDVRELLRRMTANDRHVSCEDFISSYREEIGGSEPVAREIFSKLDPARTGVVRKAEAEANIESVLAKFMNAPKHDPATERLWLRQLRERDEL